MHLKPVEQIVVLENRIRQKFDQVGLVELAASIKTLGLLSLPVCREVEGQTILVAGESRMRAMKLIWETGVSFNYGDWPVPLNTFPFQAMNELSEHNARVAELDENIKRRDITWQERTRAIAELHKLERAADPEHGTADTAEQVGMSRNSSGVVADSVLLADHLDDPEIAKAGSTKEAMKTLTRKLEREFTAALAKSTAVPTSRHTLLTGDCVELMKSIPDGTFDLILTDPPYGVNAQNFDAQMSISHEYKDDEATFKNIMQGFADEALRVMKPLSHMYICCDIRNWDWLQNMLDCIGFIVWPKPLIWVKDKGHIPRPHHGPQYRYEAILFASKGDKPVNGLFPDVIQIPIVKDAVHAAEKPVDLYLDLIRRGSIVGDTVLDPFCGSGVIFTAAEKFGLTATGIDLDTDIAEIRLKGVKV